MKKRLLSIILTVFLVLSMVPYAAFADDSIVCPACGGTVEKHSFHLVGNYWDFFKCNTCGKWAYLSGITGLKLFSAGDQQILNSADANGILNFAFNDGHLITAKVAPSGIGRKDLPGYASDDGTPAVDSNGFPSSTFSMELNGADSPYGFSLKLPLRFVDSYGGSYFKQSTNGSFSSSGGNASCYNLQPAGSRVYSNDLIVSYYFIAPFSGYYDFNVPSAKFISIVKNNSGVSSVVGSYTNIAFDVFPYSENFSSYGYFITSPPVNSSSYYHSGNYVSEPLTFTRYLAKGNIIFVDFYSHYYSDCGDQYPYKYLSIQTSTPTITGSNYEYNIVKNNSLTISKNTWNGNIYIDNSTNLTYIYPEYTTINENNETVTNISENPIIYNSETKQYYTYDTVTNNYYYITYEQQPATPTPSPSPSPAPTETPAPSESPTPDPGENPTPTPTPGGGTIVTPGGSSSGVSGGDDEGLFGWLWDLLKDLVKAILKAIFKVLSGLLGFLIWLVERVGILLPFLPAPAIAALGAGVVLVFVIRIIRFIRG